jgi:hypothetical protein
MKKGRKLTDYEIRGRTRQCKPHFVVNGRKYDDGFLPGKNSFIGKHGHVEPSFCLGELALDHPQGLHDTFVKLPHIDLNAIEI